jgi:hypothetical protein
LEGLGNYGLFYPYLFWIASMLEVAAPADTIEGTGRLHSMGRGAEDLNSAPFDIARFLGKLLEADPFPGQYERGHKHLPGFGAGQTLSTRDNSIDCKVLHPKTGEKEERQESRGGKAVRLPSRVKA